MDQQARSYSGRSKQVPKSNVVPFYFTVRIEKHTGEIRQRQGTLEAESVSAAMDEIEARAYGWNAVILSAQINETNKRGEIALMTMQTPKTQKQKSIKVLMQEAREKKENTLELTHVREYSTEWHLPTFAVLKMEDL